MTISEFKEKLSGLNIATGAKKVALTVATAPAVYAAVPSSNIVGDVQVTEDRAPIKEQEEEDIHSEFCQYDKNGIAIVDVEEIRRAIELSDALNNIAGYSNAYESSFAYNGVDMYTGESVWLSFADDTKQETLEGALSLYETLSRDEVVILSSEDPTVTYSPSRKEVQMLQNLGYTDIQARSARVSEATITLLDLSYTK